MTRERFEELADAWGADLRRWPVAERADARALLDRDALAETIFTRAAALDSILDASVVALPTSALVQAALAGAASHRVKRPRMRHRYTERWRPGIWASGVGFVGTAAAGALVFGLALSVILPPKRLSGVDKDWVATTFDAGMTADWSDE